MINKLKVQALDIMMPQNVMRISIFIKILVLSLRAKKYKLRNRQKFILKQTFSVKKVKENYKTLINRRI
jgi:hypothetical protein